MATTTIAKASLQIATSTPKIAPKLALAGQAKKIKQVASAPTTTPVITAPVTLPTPPLPTEQVNQEVRQSLVNILCTTKIGGPFASISGSGIIVDKRGVVLTNAHVGQYFLLRNYQSPDNVVCVIRTGSPAQPLYAAKLIYLPPTWVSANASQIKSQHAQGTGENDYAFLLITGPLSPSTPFPSSFTAIPMALQEPSDGDNELLAAYPAGFLDGTIIQKDLYISSAISTVSGLYTFNDNTHVDLVAVSGTVVSQSGSSGGAVARLTDGKLVGIIATETPADTTSQRALFAITIAHIERSLKAFGQGGIDTFLSQDVTKVADDFNAKVAPELTKQLETYLDKQ